MSAESQYYLDATDREYILTIADHLFRGLLVMDYITGTTSISVYRICDTCQSELITQNSGETFFCPACTNF